MSILFFILILLIGSVALPAPLHGRLVINEKSFFHPLRPFFFLLFSFFLSFFFSYRIYIYYVG